MKLLQKTQSLCPVCLRTLDAYYVAYDTQKERHVYFEKNCPQHGHFSVPAWIAKPNVPSFEQWCQGAKSGLKTGEKSGQTANVLASDSTCPHSCGLCAEHVNRSCCVLLEVTKNCNMSCPICYAGASLHKQNDDLTLTEIDNRLTWLMQNAGVVNIQISGGEPTTREDLTQIISLVHAKGFDFVQLNSNGLRLGCAHSGEQYAHTLKAAGLNLVYLQWDGMDSHTYTSLRGADYVASKERALNNCLKAQLPVLLVVTLVRGVNDHLLGDILHKALSQGPLVRGIHIQPVASFGRYPWEQAAAPRLTLPEVLHALESQSKSMLKAEHFHPPQSEHALCSFSAVYDRNAEYGLVPVHADGGACCKTAESHRENYGESQLAPAIVAREFVAKHWAGENTFQPQGVQDDFDRFLKKNTFQQRFTVSCMAFQDSYSVDLARLRACHIHIAESDARLMPFCAYNLTSSQGFPLYRNRENIHV